MRDQSETCQSLIFVHALNFNLHQRMDYVDKRVCVLIGGRQLFDIFSASNMINYRDNFLK